VKIALVQQSCSRNTEDNIQKGIHAFRQAAENGAKLISYAELGFSYFLPQNPAGPGEIDRAEPIPGPTTDIFTKLAEEYGVVTVLNLFERDGDKTYDSSPVIDSNGEILGIVRMVHIMDGMGFYEKGYYFPGNSHEYVFNTAVGKVGIAVCYDRHFPEYMRNLALNGAEIVLIPQAGAKGEWSEGMFEAEIRVAAFQNGYFAALTNRVGKEDKLTFAGESFVVNPEGDVIARAPKGKDSILYANCDLKEVHYCTAKKYFFMDRRPEYYKKFKITEKAKGEE
jgi:predicted amidohydrolase